MKKYRLVSIPCGSWKWQNRYALKSYTLKTLKNGKTVWRKFETLNRFIKPTWARTQPEIRFFLNQNGNDYVYGSLHNKVYCDSL